MGKKTTKIIKEKKIVKIISSIIIILILITTAFIIVHVVKTLKKSKNNSDLKNIFASELPVYYKNKYRIDSQNKNLRWELIPNYKGLSDGTTIRLKPFTININSDGFRDREFPIDKPDNTIRIIVLGDSITFGEGVELNTTYTKVLESLLNSKNNCKYYFEVLNMGIPVYDLLGKIEILKVKGIKYNPDIVILQYNYDDLMNQDRIGEIQMEI